jgi:hypothetical protein
MHRARKRAACAAALFAVSGTACAFTAGELRSACKSAAQVHAGWVPKDVVEAVEVHRCLSFMLGIRDSQSFTRLLTGGAVVCTRNAVTPGQIAAIYVKAVDERPETWNEDASTVAMLVLMKTFPCPSTPKAK